ncbi:unnamed protein product [Euphydryas editha]|uniref:HTH OST-type domain-containing protein n=1 Tax=Euphydryas editha TaxID=104508 RepID=A0AAU9TUN5_EUPED|nr:unnamed protein product [Euphydryas editha]
MDEELKQLKSVLRSLVVSSPTQVDVRSLCRDYRNMIGQQIPSNKFGYKDPTTFLREKFSDCFIFQGPSTNPVLTLIVPDALKHIDKFVQKQRTPVTAKFKGKRRSVPESVAKPVEPDLIVRSFTTKTIQKNEEIKPPSVDTEKINNKNQLTIPTSPQSYESESEKVVYNGNCSQSALKNFLKKRTPNYTSQGSLSDKSSNDKESISKDDDSGRQTLSSMCISCC